MPDDKVNSEGRRYGYDSQQLFDDATGPGEQPGQSGLQTWQRPAAERENFVRPVEKLDGEQFSANMRQALRKLERLDALGEVKDVEPLVQSLNATMDELADIYGQATADKAMAMINTTVKNYGATQDILTFALGNVLETILNAPELFATNNSPAMASNWENSLVSRWNCDLGVLLMSDQEKAKSAGSVKSISYALLDFFDGFYQMNGYGNAAKTKGFVQTAGLLFPVKLDENGKFEKADGSKVDPTKENIINAQVSYGAVEAQRYYLHSYNPYKFEEEVVLATDRQDLSAELKVAAEFLRGQLGSEAAARQLEETSSAFIYAALNALNTIYEEKGEQAGLEAMRYFNDTFSNMVNAKTSYLANQDAKADNIELFFNGFSNYILDADKREMNQLFFWAGQESLENMYAQKPFYATWGYKSSSWLDGTSFSDRLYLAQDANKPYNLKEQLDNFKKMAADPSAVRTLSPAYYVDGGFCSAFPQSQSPGQAQLVQISPGVTIANAVSYNQGWQRLNYGPGIFFSAQA